MKRRAALLLFLTVLLGAIIPLSGCQKKTEDKIVRTAFYFDTVVTLTLYDKEGAAEIQTDLFSYCQELENVLSAKSETSELYRLNHGPHEEPTEISPLLADAVREALYFARITDGAFDPTVGALTSLWDVKNRRDSLPDKADIEKALSTVGWKNVVLTGGASVPPGKKAYLPPPGEKAEQEPVYISYPQETQLDLGGIAKGYIGDLLKTRLENAGTEHALLDLGGNLICVGTRPDGSNYLLGVKDPLKDGGQPILALAVSDRSVVTSGIYERYFMLDGVRYHHLISPRTGWPFDNGLASVTVISERSADGDGLSTGLFGLGPEKGLELVNSLPGIDAVFITTDGKILYSENARNYVYTR